MKKLLITLAAVLASASTFGQGTIRFNTRVVGQVDAPVSRADGTGAGAGFNAQLFLVSGGTPTTYTALNPATTFRTTNAVAAYYVVQPPGPVIVPGIEAGQQATIVMRVWEGPVGSSYDTAVSKGQTLPITITLGGVPPTGAPTPDAELAGMQGFTILPERR